MKETDSTLQWNKVSAYRISTQSPIIDDNESFIYQIQNLASGTPNMALIFQLSTLNGNINKGWKLQNYVCDRDVCHQSLSPDQNYLYMPLNDHTSGSKGVVCRLNIASSQFKCYLNLDASSPLTPRETLLMNLSMLYISFCATANSLTRMKLNFDSGSTIWKTVQTGTSSQSTSDTVYISSSDILFSLIGWGSNGVITLSCFNGTTGVLIGKQYKTSSSNCNVSYKIIEISNVLYMTMSCGSDSYVVKYDITSDSFIHYKGNGISINSLTANNKNNE